MVAIGCVVESASVGWVDRTGFLKAGALASNAVFRARVSVAMCRVAGDIGGAILASAADGPISVPDKQRYLMAIDVLRNPADWLDGMCATLTSLSAINAASDDSDLVYWITQMWNLIANVPV